MDQIKRGQKLRKVDVDRLKQEQQAAWRRDQRKSVMMVRSLEDTISLFKKHFPLSSKTSLSQNHMNRICIGNKVYIRGLWR